jgi:hypothetical protein
MEAYLNDYRDTPFDRFLKSWWFFTPEWPPQDYDFSPEIEKLRWRVVTLENWENEPNIEVKLLQFLCIGECFKTLR